MSNLKDNLQSFLTSSVHAVRIGQTSVIAARVSGSSLGPDPAPAPKAEDSTLVCMQLAPITRNTLWKSGKVYWDKPYQTDSIEIIHLTEEPQSYVPVSFDCFHLEIPDLALSAFAQLQHRKAPSLLRCRPAEIDMAMRQLANALMPTLESARDEASKSGGLFMDQVVFAMLAHLSERYANWRTSPTSAGRMGPRQLQLVTERLTADFRDEPSLEELARLAGLPVSRLVDEFRNTTGMTPARFMRATRIDAAREMLFRTALPLKEIAFRCGFADPSHFSRVFAAEVGMTPAAWRRER